MPDIRLSTSNQIHKLQFSMNFGAGSGLPSDVSRPQNNPQELKSNKLSQVKKVVNSVNIIMIYDPAPDKHKTQERHLSNNK